MDETVHISSLVVQIQPRNLDALKTQCLAYKSREATIEIAAVDPAGKVVVLLETPSRQHIVDFIDWLQLREGVRAVCSDCHVPHNWTDKIARKMQASKEVWGHIFGIIDTREKFLDHRLEMASREWRRFEANDSLECRNCHDEQFMDFTRQSSRAAAAHQRGLVEGDATCITCHKGIAHELPDMAGVHGWE